MIYDISDYVSLTVSADLGETPFEEAYIKLASQVPPDALTSLLLLVSPSDAVTAGKIVGAYENAQEKVKINGGKRLPAKIRIIVVPSMQKDSWALVSDIDMVFSEGS